ncbi:MAG: helix-turn-helix transcriptional regulator [Lachnospiraceae bacterium]|nr:helix-turn-helix transcriptional regulator [Lachnospiraceae bacterium]
MEQEHFFFDHIKDAFHFPTAEQREHFFSVYETYLSPNPAFWEDTELPFVHAGGFIRHSTPFSCEIRNLPYYLLIYAVSMHGELSAEQKKASIAKDTLFLLPPNRHFRLHTAPPSCSYYICFLSGKSLETYFSRISRSSSAENQMAESSPFADIKLHGDNSLQLFKQLEQLLKNPGEDANFFMVNNIGRIFAECILENKPQTNVIKLPKHVTEMKTIFDTEYTEPVSLQNLEDRLGVSKYRLCRDFSSHIGLSPLKYLNKKRLEEAKKLLFQTDLPIHIIGEQVGIPNTTHFIRLFTRETGVTPLQFRETQNKL